MTLRATPLLLAALLVTGCKHTASPAAASTEAPVAAPVNPATAGAITGVVHFTGKPPARVPIDMSMDPACAMSTTPNQTEQYVIDHGNLANVYVYVKAGIPSSSAPASAPPVVLDQKGCRYIPHVIAVQQGGRVQFRNSDPTMHNVHTIPTNPGNASVDLSEPPMGQPQTETFKAAEIMLPVRCNNHPWMEAFINIAPNPYYAVTAADGSFTIPNLPPGTYTLAAIHEKLGEQDMQITVAPKATAQANFSFSIK
jgi:plastocyanin